jgi:hypothetical protein
MQRKKEPDFQCFSEGQKTQGGFQEMISAFSARSVVDIFFLLLGRARPASFGYLLAFGRAQAEGPAHLDLDPFPWYFK